MGNWFRHNTVSAVILMVFGIIGSVFSLIGWIFYRAMTRLAWGGGSGMPSFFPFIFIGIGGAFLLTAAIVVGCSVAKNKKRRGVIARGNQVQATVTDVRINSMVEVNGRHPYVVECRYDGAGASYLLKSENIFTGPPNVRIGDQVPVFWDDYEPKYYTVDLSGCQAGELVDLR